MKKVQRIHNTSKTQARFHIPTSMLIELGWGDENCDIYGEVCGDEIVFRKRPELIRSRLQVMSHYNCINLPIMFDADYDELVRLDSKANVLTVKYFR